MKKEGLFPQVLALYERKECQITTSLSLNSFLITSNVLLCKLKLSIVAFLRVSVPAMKHHDQKASWRGKGLFGLYFHVALHHRRKSGQKLKTGQEPESMQWPLRSAAYWLSSFGLFSLLSYRTQDH